MNTVVQQNIKEWQIKAEERKRKEAKKKAGRDFLRKFNRIELPKEILRIGR